MWSRRRRRQDKRAARDVLLLRAGGGINPRTRRLSTSADQRSFLCLCPGCVFTTTHTHTRRLVTSRHTHTHFCCCTADKGWRTEGGVCSASCPPPTVAFVVTHWWLWQPLSTCKWVCVCVCSVWRLIFSQFRAEKFKSWFRIFFNWFFPKISSSASGEINLFHVLL